MNEMNYFLLTITLNEELFKRTQTAAISAHIKEKILKLTGHVLRKETSEIPKGLKMGLHLGKEIEGGVATS